MRSASLTIRVGKCTRIWLCVACENATRNCRTNAHCVWRGASKRRWNILKSKWHAWHSYCWLFGDLFNCRRVAIITKQQLFHKRKIHYFFFCVFFFAFRNSSRIRINLNATFFYVRIWMESTTKMWRNSGRKITLAFLVRDFVSLTNSNDRTMFENGIIGNWKSLHANQKRKTKIENQLSTIQRFRFGGFFIVFFFSRRDLLFLHRRNWMKEMRFLTVKLHCACSMSLCSINRSIEWTRNEKIDCAQTEKRKRQKIIQRINATINSLFSAFLLPTARSSCSIWMPITWSQGKEKKECAVVNAINQVGNNWQRIDQRPHSQTDADKLTHVHRRFNWSRLIYVNKRNNFALNTFFMSHFVDVVVAFASRRTNFFLCHSNWWSASFSSSHFLLHRLYGFLSSSLVWHASKSCVLVPVRMTWDSCVYSGWTEH